MAPTQIWLSQGGQRRGPMSTADAQALITQGAYAADDLAWVVGTAAWSPIAECTALHHDPHDAVDSAPLKKPHHDILGWQTHNVWQMPWTRFCARCFDRVFLWASLCCIAGAISSTFAGQHTLFLSFVVQGLQIPYEALAIHLFGATLGKGCFGISILHPDGAKLSLAESTTRAAYVLTMGEALHLPLVTWVSQLFAASAIKKPEGPAWDRVSGALPRYKQAAVLQRCLGLLMIGVIIWATQKRAPIVDVHQWVSK